MSSEIIKQHYISLVKLLNIYRTKNISKLHLHDTHRFCQTLLTDIKVHPDLVFAQAQLYKAQLPYTTNLAFNACLHVCLLGVRNKVDESVCVQLMCTALSILGSNQSAFSANNSQNNPKDKPQLKKNSLFANLLKKHNQHIWQATYPSITFLNHQDNESLKQLTKLQSLLVIGYKFSLLCTPNKAGKESKTVTFHHAFKQISLLVPAHWYQYLTPLLEYPSLTPPGSFIKHKDNSLRIVVAIDERGLVVKPMQVKPKAVTKEAKGSASDIEVISRDKISQCYAAQSINNISKLKYWWDSGFDSYTTENSTANHIQPFTKKLALQSPPASLLVIQDQLTNINTDISVITKAIEKEPSYVQQLKQSATIGNRQQQPVESIQHGLAMLGYERTSCLLLEHSLLSRLNQEYFPLQKQLIVFSSFYAAIASELASHCKLMTIELVSSTSYFVLSRLFTLPQLKTQINWQISPKRYFELANLINVKANDTLKNGAIVLAQAWQQNNAIMRALKSYDSVEVLNNQTKNNQLGFMLGLSLIKAQEVYFDIQINCQDTQKYLDSAVNALNITELEMTQITQTAIDKSVIYSPIN
ncbi:hypothetical protein L0668_09900 [Paraglaciecola aquimarina]|uniref:HDOD domain-containing protein n=1 Tax=Paraglaciecola algarum TaxID=3050085 RepID=A0ABS9D686_9ALTE|nr:hypothetical protein [Paraglaciecola sp. G1-23]MCF2948419.1 hypothetical protein [Paraglaciecola sp. G1-23]